jgi:magnesium-transporting ATPase (P-type)
MAVSTVVGAEMFYLLNSRYIYKTVLTFEGLFGNYYVLIAIAACAVLQIAYTHAEPMQALFDSTDLSVDEWLKVICAGMLVFIIAELEKFLIRWLFGDRFSHSGKRDDSKAQT